MNTPTLETERLILRKFTEKNPDALFLILKDEKANRFLPWYPLKTPNETIAFLTSVSYEATKSQPRRSKQP